MAAETWSWGFGDLRAMVTLGFSYALVTFWQVTLGFSYGSGPR